MIIKNEKNYIKYKGLTIIEKIFSGKNRVEKLPKGYLQIKSYSKYQEELPNYEVGLYKDHLGKKVIIKWLKFKFKNIKYVGLINENNVLNVLSNKIGNIKRKEIKAIFPKIYKFYLKDNQIVIIREYINGERLFKFKSKRKILVIKDVIKLQRELSKKLTENEKNLFFKHSPFRMFLSFPLYASIAFLKNPKIGERILLSTIYFYRNYLDKNIFIRNYVLTNRDLHSSNIIMRNKFAYIIDTEDTVIAEDDSELAITARHFVSELPIKELLQVISDEALNKNRFIRLSIFYTLQLLATEHLDKKYYKDSNKFLYLLINKIIPELKKTPSKLVNKAHNNNLRKYNKIKIITSVSPSI